MNEKEKEKWQLNQKSKKISCLNLIWNLTTDLETIKKLQIHTPMQKDQSAAAAEYTGCTSAEG